VQGGGLDQLTEDELERLIHLIGQPPDDNSKLPPVGHRIVLQIAAGSEILARVCDLANAPETVLGNPSRQPFWNSTNHAGLSPSEKVAPRRVE
jgi:hypothetical protein